MASYRQILKSFNLSEQAPKNPKPGDIWKTDTGFRGVNQSGNRQTFQDKEKTQKYVATKDAPKDEPKSEKEPAPEKKPSSKDPLNTDELKAKQANLASEIKDSGVGPVMDYRERLTDLKARLAIKEENAETEKERKAIDNMVKTLDASDMPKDRKDAMALATAIGFAYGSRKNVGVGLASLGMADRDALVVNMPRLNQMYDDAIPKEVEKGVRTVRKFRYTEESVRASFKTLPEKLQSALQRKGKVGDSIKDVGGHFNGYVALHPDTGKEYTTSDFRDPNIKGSDGSDNPDTDKLEVKRGNTGNTARGMAVWRIYMEQGGIDAYTGMPLDLESMDLEHVVGYNNSDKGKATTEDYANREHERNQVLCSSRANQQKSDQSMEDFNSNNVDSLKDMGEEDFAARDKAYETVNQASTVTEQTALRLQGDIRYEMDGTSETTTDPEKASKSESGTPKVASATLGPNVTPDVLQKEFDAEDAQLKTIKTGLVGESGPIKEPEDIKTIKGIKSKIGRRIVQAMGLPRGTTDVSGRRTNPIYSSDGDYRKFGLAMAKRDYADRQEMKDAWTEGMALVGTDEVRKLAKSDKKVSQKIIFDMYIRGDAEGLEGLGLKVPPDVKKTLGSRGNILGEQKEQYQYESLEGTISRMKR